MAKLVRLADMIADALYSDDLAISDNDRARLIDMAIALKIELEDCQPAE